MGKEINRYTMTDENGEHLIIEYSNGVKTSLLQKPSSEYKKRQKIKQENYRKTVEEKRKIREREKLIQDRMKEIAIRELKEEGKL